MNSRKSVQAKKNRVTARRVQQKSSLRKVAGGTRKPPEINTHWTFLSNHGYVLACLARDPGVRLRDVALLVGITERAVQKIVADLEAGGVLARVREGRRNHYELFRDRPLRHSLGSHQTVGALLDLMLSSGEGTPLRVPGELL